MGRFIEVRNPATILQPLGLRVGDVLLIYAGGATLDSGGEERGIVRMLPPLQIAAIATDGRVLAPSGPPNVVLVLAERVGAEHLRVVTGDPWSTSKSTRLEIVVSERT